MKTRLTDLTTRYNDVTAKYNAIRQDIQNQREQYRQTQQKHILEIGHDKQQKEEDLFVEYQKRRTEVESLYKDKTELATNNIEQLKLEQTEVEKELLKLRYWQPYQEELSTLNKEQEHLAMRTKELRGLISGSSATDKQLQAEYDKQEADIINESKRLQERKQKEIAETQQHIEELEKLLNRSQGSLYEWLEENQQN